MINNELWKYKIGKGSVVIFSPLSVKFVVGYDKILGMNWDSIERYRWKNRGSDHYANIKPSHIAKWIEINTQYHPKNQPNMTNPKNLLFLIENYILENIRVHTNITHFYDSLFIVITPLNYQNANRTLICYIRILNGQIEYTSHTTEHEIYIPICDPQSLKLMVELIKKDIPQESVTIIS